MNRVHHWICGSQRWQRNLEQNLLPWVLDDVDMGANVLELGPGPGLTTALLASRCAHLTAIEPDTGLAARLRHSRRDVDVVQGDGALLPFQAGAFSTVVAFTMLHHMPSAESQDRLFREARRILAPDGCFAGSDSLSSLLFRALHAWDTCVPVPPESLVARLREAGFSEAAVEVRQRSLRFVARP